jgi:hypothetical protein
MQQTTEARPFLIDGRILACLVGLYVGLGTGLANYHRPVIHGSPSDMDIYRSHLRLASLNWELMVSAAVGVVVAAVVASVLWRCERFQTHESECPHIGRSLVTCACGLLPAFLLWQWHNDSYTMWFMVPASIIAQQIVYVYQNPLDVGFLADLTIEAESRRAKLALLVSEAKLYRAVTAGSAVFLIIGAFKTSTSVHELLNYKPAMAEEVVRRILYIVFYAFAGLYGALVPIAHWRVRWLLGAHNLITSRRDGAEAPQAAPSPKPPSTETEEPTTPCT